MAQVFESFKNFRKFLLLLGYQSEKMKNKLNKYSTRRCGNGKRYYSTLAASTLNILFSEMLKLSK
jgi:hypothetical protein